MTKNKLFITRILFLIFLAASLFVTACKEEFTPESSYAIKEKDSNNVTSQGKVNLSLACWNTQTFFDAVSDGCEYKDFQRPEKWNKEKYSKRLDSLCEIMSLLSSDILVLIEIENEAVVQDITNRLAGSEWSKKRSWQYACFAKEPGSAIGCAVFSRFELFDLKVHSLDIRTQKTEQPSSRPVMQVSVRSGEKELTIFINHWKSKSGGEEDTEIWRDWQEALLAEKIKSNKSSCLVACGDFNRSAEDFVISADRVSETNILLRSMDGSLVSMYSPWIDLNGKTDKEKGSYFYKDEWERIDNIISTGKEVISRFQAVSISPLVDENGKPQSYKIYENSGYSDHLPVKCVIQF